MRKKKPQNPGLVSIFVSRDLGVNSGSENMINGEFGEFLNKASVFLWEYVF